MPTPSLVVPKAASVGLDSILLPAWPETKRLGVHPRKLVNLWTIEEFEIPLRR
jgi:hypothetical protein